MNGENVKEGTFLSSFIDPSFPYINVELQVFHLTLTLNTDGGARADVICARISQFSPLFLSKIVDLLRF